MAEQYFNFLYKNSADTLPLEKLGAFRRTPEKAIYTYYNVGNYNSSSAPLTLQAKDGKDCTFLSLIGENYHSTVKLNPFQGPAIATCLQKWASNPLIDTMEYRLFEEQNKDPNIKHVHATIFPWKNGQRGNDETLAIPYNAHSLISEFLDNISDKNNGITVPQTKNQFNGFCVRSVNLDGGISIIRISSHKPNILIEKTAMLGFDPKGSISDVDYSQKLIAPHILKPR
jgi:hypothetical protein